MLYSVLRYQYFGCLVLWVLLLCASAVATIDNPEELSQQLNLLVKGAIVDAYVSGNKDAANRAKNIASILIN